MVLDSNLLRILINGNVYDAIETLKNFSFGFYVNFKVSINRDAYGYIFFFSWKSQSYD